jgi:transposase
MSVYVGIDVHRKRSQIAVLDEEGTVRINRNVPNGVKPVLGVIGDLPIGTPVAFEAAYGWGWLVEMLEDYGYRPHLVHPLRCKAIASARLKNDKVDAATLGQLLRADLLPEAWIAPLEVRQQRALLRHRFQLVRVRTLLRNRVHAVLADLGRQRAGGGVFTGPGRAWLASLDLPDASRRVVDDLVQLMDALQAPHRCPGRTAGRRCPRRPASQGPHRPARGRHAHRAGDRGRGRRRHPVSVSPQARRLGRPHPDRTRLGSHRPVRAHLQAR